MPVNWMLPPAQKAANRIPSGFGRQDYGFGVNAQSGRPNVVPVGTGANARQQMLGQHGGGFSYSENPQWYQQQGQKYGWDMSQFTNPGGGQPGGGATPPGVGQTGYSSAAAAQQQQSQQPGRITTGIGVNPIMPSPQVDMLKQQLMQFAQPVGLSAGQQGHLGDLMRQQGEVSGLDFERQAALANAQHIQQAQQARAGAGLGWGGIMAQDELANTQQALSALRGIMSMFEPDQWLQGGLQ